MGPFGGVARPFGLQGPEVVYRAVEGALAAGSRLLVAGVEISGSCTYLRILQSMAREKDLERRVAQIERNQDLILRELGQFRNELRALGLDVPDLDPARDRPKLSPQARLALLRRAAATARASKEVGEGKGALNSPETAARLREEAQALLREADEQEAT